MGESEKDFKRYKTKREEIRKKFSEMNESEWNKKCDFESHRQGNNLASSVLRSMYPSKSRGSMAKEFAHVFCLGAEWARAEVIKEVKQDNDMFALVRAETIISLKHDADELLAVIRDTANAFKTYCDDDEGDGETSGEIFTDLYRYVEKMNDLLKKYEATND